MELHHRDILGVALRRMREQLNNAERDDLIADIMKELEPMRSLDGVVLGPKPESGQYSILNAHPIG
jgi:hypothetical protein